MGRRSAFVEAVASIRCEVRDALRPSQFDGRPLSNAVVSQHYKKSGHVADHEAVPHPVGTLFIVNRDYEIHLYAGVGGGSAQEKTTDDGNHTVVACYGGGHASDEKLSLSTSHNLGLNNCLKVHYANDLRRDAYCSLHACHQFDEESFLSTSFQEGLCSDPVIEVELQQGKGEFKTSGKLERNFVTAHQQLYIQSKALLPAELIMRNSISTDLRGDGNLGLELASASRFFSISSSVLLGLSGSKELSLQGSQSFWKTTLAEVSAFTNFDGQQSISLEAKHKVGEQNEVSMKLTSNCFSTHEVNIKTSLFREKDSWKWKYRKGSADGHSLGLEWQHKITPNNFYSLNIELKRQGLMVNGELCLSL